MSNKTTMTRTCDSCGRKDDAIKVSTGGVGSEIYSKRLIGWAVLLVEYEESARRDDYCPECTRKLLSRVE